MIERAAFGYTATCDECGFDEDFTDAESFQQTVDEMKGYGWRIFHDKDGWNHLCRDCK